MIDWFWLIPVAVVALAIGGILGRRMPKSHFRSDTPSSHRDKTAARALGAANRELPP